MTSSLHEFSLGSSIYPIAALLTGSSEKMCKTKNQEMEAK